MSDLDVNAEVHTQLAHGYRIKVSLGALGVYMHGFRALPPKDGKGWALYPPQTRNPKNGQYIDILEFDKSKPAWLGIRDACIQAVNTFSGDDDGLDDPDFHNKLDSEFSDTIKRAENTKSEPLQTIPWMNDDEELSK